MSLILILIFLSPFINALFALLLVQENGMSIIGREAPIILLHIQIHICETR